MYIFRGPDRVSHRREPELYIYTVSYVADRLSRRDIKTLLKKNDHPIFSELAAMRLSRSNAPYARQINSGSEIFCAGGATGT